MPTDLINEPTATLTADRATGEGTIAVDDGSVFGQAFPIALTAYHSGAEVTTLAVSLVQGDTVFVSGPLAGFGDADLFTGDTLVLRRLAPVKATLQSELDALPPIPTAVQPSEKVINLSALNLDARTTGATDLAPASAGDQIFHPTMVAFEVASASGVTGAPTISIGTNSTSYDNILAPTVLTGLTATGHFLLVPLSGLLPSLPIFTTIYAKVTSAATGTTLTLNIYVLGFDWPV